MSLVATAPTIRKSAWHGRAVRIVVVLLLASGLGYLGLRIYRQSMQPAKATVPVARVERGDVTLSITAKGELQGGNPEILSAPMTAGGNLHITFLRKPGEQVKAGDVVVQFDTTEQRYKLKEAESDLAEANQKIVQAKAKHDAEMEEDRYSLIKAQNDLTLAELEARKNRVMPLFQVGDAANPGMAIAEIPDLGNWQIAANVGELDRGHISVGNPVDITVIAVPQRRFHGASKEMGGTTGPFWDRHFESRIALTDPIPALRPGMSTMLVITTQTLKNVLSVPAQALFDTAGKTTMYVRTGNTFTSREVRLVQKNETRAVISGLREGQSVALSNPLDTATDKAHDSSPLGTVGK